MIKASVPLWIGAARDSDCFLIRVGDHNKSAEADIGHRTFCPAGFPPPLAIAIDKAPSFRGGIQADDMQTLACRPLGAVDRVNAIPDWRMRLLQRFQLHRDILESKKVAAKIEGSFGEALYDQLQSLRVDLLRLCRVESIEGSFGGRGSTAEADLQSSPAHLIEHTDFFDQPNRMVKRQRIDQWAETKSLRALCYSSQKYAGRGCHAEGRRVMLGNVIGIEAHLIISLDKLEACLVVILQWQIAAVQMVEYAKFHRSDQGPFAGMNKNLMRFADESTG